MSESGSDLKRAAPEGAPVAAGRDAGRRHVFMKGVWTPERAREAARMVGGNVPVYVEAHSLEAFESIGNVKHLSDFGPAPGEPSARQSGRAWVAQVSDAVLPSTGRPAWKSFTYRGISAWWFLEIIFQEPAYLSARRQQALKKAAAAAGKGATAFDELLPDPANARLPTVPAQRWPARPPSWLGRLKLELRTWAYHQKIRFGQWRYLSGLKRSDVLCLIEHENLRRHLDLSLGEVRAVLPYAEGVVEALRERLGDRCAVLARRSAPIPFEGWEFLHEGLPPLSPGKPLPPGFDAALKDVYALVRPVVNGHYSLHDLREVMSFRLAEYDFYLDLLARVKPRVLFAYNWEGVFRPLTTAARVSGCRMVGVQQALGPYLHALDHRETGYYGPDNPLGFAVPDRLAVWGSLHREEIGGYGYPDAAGALEVTGYARLDKHFKASADKDSSRARACAHMGLPAGNRYLLFTGQFRVLDTVILLRENFLRSIDCLCALAMEFGLRIIMKPWTSDDVSLVEKVATENPGLIYIAPQDVLISNADLLSITDIAVGTFSSILGEATLSGNACVLLNYPESRYYFDIPHVEAYRGMTAFVDSPDRLEAALRPLLEDEDARLRAVERARLSMDAVFGPCDGMAAKRIAHMVLDEIN